MSVSLNLDPHAVWTWVVAVLFQDAKRANVQVYRVWVNGYQEFKAGNRGLPVTFSNPDVDLTDSKPVYHLTEMLIMLDGWFSTRKFAEEAMEEGLDSDEWDEYFDSVEESPSEDLN